MLLQVGLTLSPYSSLRVNRRASSFFAYTFTGHVSYNANGDDVAMCASHVLSLGAPKTGLLTAQDEPHFQTIESWDLRVADIGIPNAAWAHYGRKGKLGAGVRFGGKWIVGLEYCDDSQGRA